MAVYNPATTPVVPSQNPDPNGDIGQTYIAHKQELVSQIMAAFRTNLPSNYVSAINGPYYTITSAVAAIPTTLTGHSCVIIRDGAIYPEQVTVRNFINNEFVTPLDGLLPFPPNTALEASIP